ncbi:MULTISPECIES: phytoene/squalene synthase family protein [unclassified Ornithinimicrobium]|uniref:phytoene/squalene synthase family protein n=1 Tax=unclassified Ornithinimicrobium TaxID=2615080 RepID=UPI003852F0AF
MKSPLRRREPLSANRYDETARASAGIVIDRYSTSFGWATRMLDEPVRTHVRCIYALVRVADELVDDEDQDWGRDDRAAVLDGLHQETLRAVGSGCSANLVVHAFALTAREHGIRPEIIDPFFDSMRADLSVQVHDPQSLSGYVYGSAEVVGLMCLRVFVGGDEARYEQLAPGARSLGAAFQKVNFLRDLHADQSVLGRTYFPGVDLTTFTDTERDLLLDDIDADLDAAARVIPLLPTSSRRAVHAAHALFAELSARLRATPATVIARERVRVPDLVKARILARSALVGR